MSEAVISDDLALKLGCIQPSGFVDFVGQITQPHIRVRGRSGRVLIWPLDPQLCEEISRRSGREHL